MKIIETQNGEILIAENLSKISRIEAEGTEKGTVGTKTFYGLQVVDSSGFDTDLALYNTENQMDEVFRQLKSWLAFSDETLFTMPEEEHYEG